jgi:Superinfection immunity protein
VISSVVSFIVVTSLTCMSLALYLLPCLIGCARRAPDIGAIAVIDILLGWTFIGWVVALAMAFRSAPPSLPPPPAATASCAQRFGPPASRPGSPPPLFIPSKHPPRREDVGYPHHSAPWAG